MAKHRLINCEFLNASSFKANVSNKAKLLYVFMLMNGDDRGFVDSTQDLVNALKINDDNFTKTENTSLLEDTYETALLELLDKGYIYEFKDNHLNKVHLIRHWFYHNKYKVGLWTNYTNFLDRVYLKNNEYLLGEKPSKEEDVNQEVKEEDTEWKQMTFQKMFGVEHWCDLTPEQKKKWTEYVDEHERKIRNKEYET